MILVMFRSAFALALFSTVLASPVKRRCDENDSLLDKSSCQPRFHWNQEMVDVISQDTSYFRDLVRLSKTSKVLNTLVKSSIPYLNSTIGLRRSIQQYCGTEVEKTYLKWRVADQGAAVIVRRRHLNKIFSNQECLKVFTSRCNDAIHPFNQFGDLNLVLDGFDMVVAFKNSLQNWASCNVKVILELEELRPNELSIVINSFTTFPRLVRFELDDTFITETFRPRLFHMLQVNVELREIGLGNAGLGNPGAIHLANFISNLSKLEKIDLHLNAIGHDGIQQLADTMCKLPRLAHLILDNNMISSHSLRNLRECLPKLQSLSITANQLTDAGICWLSNELQNQNNISSLELDSNPIDNDGGICLGRFLLSNMSLKYLSLTDTDLGDNIILYFASIAASRKTLRIDV